MNIELKNAQKNHWQKQSKRMNIGIENAENSNSRYWNIWIENAPKKENKNKTHINEYWTLECKNWRWWSKIKEECKISTTLLKQKQCWSQPSLLLQTSSSSINLDLTRSNHKLCTCDVCHFGNAQEHYLLGIQILNMF